MSDQFQYGPRWPAIVEPDMTVGGVYETVMTLKMSMELLTGQRGFDESYSVDSRFDTVTKSLNDLSATVSTQITVAINDNSALAQRVDVVEAEIYDARNGEPDLHAAIVKVDTASVTRDGAIATSVSQVNAKADANTASITNVHNASVGRDDALSSSIQTVDAKVNGVSAGGYFGTYATVQGDGTTLASMEAYVWTTGAHTANTTAGWRTKVEGGQGYFDIYTSVWRLIDNGGTPKTVMSYYSGQFHFNGNMALDGNLVVSGTIDNPQLANWAANFDKLYPNSATSSASAEGAAQTVTAYLNVRAGSQIQILGFQAGFDTNSTGGGGGSTLYVLLNGGVWKAVTAPSTQIVVGLTGDGSPQYNNVVPSMTPLFVWSATYTGTVTVQLQQSGGPGSYQFKTLVVQELAK